MDRGVFMPSKMARRWKNQERSLEHTKLKSKTKIDKSIDYDGRFIMQKTADWSLLNDGMTIPVSECALQNVLPPKEEQQRVFEESRWKEK